jgi:hypothetical protein
MNPTASWVSEPQQLQFVSQRVRSRVTTFTKAPHVRLERLQEGAATEGLRRSGRLVPLARERGPCSEYSGP